MTARALAAAVLTLAPSGAVLGEVPSGTTLPWISVRVRVPGVLGRSDAATAQGRTGRVQVTVAGVTDESVLITGQTVVDAMEGSRPVAAGWLTGPLLLSGDPSLYSDDVVIAGVNRHVQVAALSFEFTASPTA